MNNSTPDNNKVAVTPTNSLPGNRQLSLTTPTSGCLAEIGWHLASWALPCFSFNFYRLATRRSVGSAVLFFLILALIFSTIPTFTLGVAMLQSGLELRRSFDNGIIPAVVIRGGRAEVTGKQPYIFADDARMLMAIDTTGKLTDVDPRQYEQGMLLTQTELIVLNQRGQYEKVPLADLQTAFKTDPIIINRDTVTFFWIIFATIFTVVVFIFLILWNSIVRLAYLALMSLVLWGIVSLIRRGTNFGPILITGLYALIPALFVVFLLWEVKIEFPGLTTFFLSIFWILGLIAALMPKTEHSATAPVINYFLDERPLRGWRTLIALPLLIDLILESFFHWRAWYVTYPLVVISLGGILIASILPLIRTQTKPTLENIT